MDKVASKQTVSVPRDDACPSSGDVINVQLDRDVKAVSFALTNGQTGEVYLQGETPTFTNRDRCRAINNFMGVVWLYLDSHQGTVCPTLQLRTRRQ